MTRPEKFPRETLIAEAVALAARAGPAAITITAVAAAASAPSGSVYHRFASRDALLAEVWLTCVEAFRRDFSEAAATAASPGALAAFVVRWARTHRPHATVLAAHDARDFSADEALRARASRARDVAKHFADLAERFAGTRDPAAVRRAIFAFATVPLAALREPLRSGAPITDEIEELVSTTALALFPTSQGRHR